MSFDLKEVNHQECDVILSNQTIFWEGRFFPVRYDGLQTYSYPSRGFYDIEKGTCRKHPFPYRRGKNLFRSHFEKTILSVIKRI